MPEMQRQTTESTEPTDPQPFRTREPEIAIVVALGYVWAAFNTLIGLLLAVVFYRARGFRWSDGCLEAVGGSFQRDGKTVTRIWGRPGAQTWGWFIVYRTEAHVAKAPLRVHERVHVAQGMVGGPLFLLAYGLHFLIEFAWTARFRPSRWYDAYRRVWAERMAYRIEDEFRRGLRPNAWGANPRYFLGN
ncbi:MAG: hypothetical protein JSV86_10490 [Gemmatimonadota bacterium]|nr:MAG: hypothetical protein JSV86_10490 [Gemmatimonadota bacterium]